MSGTHVPLEVADFGLTDASMLEAATRLSPALFRALHAAHTLDTSHFPIETAAAIGQALATVAKGDPPFLVGSTRFPDELLPVIDKLDLLRKLFLALMIDHRASSQREWARAQSGALVLAASHPLPMEAF
jgi:hypothetical protein